jgi:type II restriction enzyme
MYLSDEARHLKLETYKKLYNVTNITDTVKLFQKTIIATNRTPEFYVDWKKVQKNLDEIKIELALWNSLINSNNIESDFKKLITEYPEVIKTIPILHAIREREFPVIIDFHEKEVEVKHLDFNKTKYSKLTETEIDDYIEFSQKSGIYLIFKHIKNFYDYVFGVEVGLDTNARKNRSGTAMETLLTPILREISNEIGSHLLTQKDFASVTMYGGHPPQGLANRTADYIIFKGSKYVNIEVNYFSGAGSKPEEIVDSYINRKNELEKVGWGFIWVTDGDAWTNSENQIRKAFTDMDYVLNIQFIRSGLLKEALTQFLG